MSAPQPSNLNEKLVLAILDEVNQFIDPPTVTGVGIAPSERLWLAQQIADRIADAFDLSIKGCPHGQPIDPNCGSRVLVCAR